MLARLRAVARRLDEVTPCMSNNIEDRIDDLEREVDQLRRYGQRPAILDGEREHSESPALNVVLNWFEELKERVPVP